MAKVILHQGKAGWDQQQVIDLLTELGHDVALDDWPLGQERAVFHKIEDSKKKKLRTRPPADPPRSGAERGGS